MKVAVFLIAFFMLASLANAKTDRNTIYKKYKTAKDTTKSDDDSDSEDDEDSPNSFEVSTTGGSNLIQQGKKLPTQQYYLAPSFTYSHSIGITAGIGAKYLPETGKKKAWDDVSLTAGYSHAFMEHLNIGLNYTYTKYYSETQVMASEPHTFAFTSSFDNKIITPSISASYYMGDTVKISDFIVVLGLSHNFTWKDNLTTGDEFTIPISASALLGTSNFYNNYVVKAQKNGKLKAKPGKIPKHGSTTVDADTNFGLTSIAFSGALSYTIKGFTLSPAASYSISTNNDSFVVADKPDFTLTLTYSF